MSEHSKQTLAKSLTGHTYLGPDVLDIANEQMSPQGKLKTISLSNADAGNQLSTSGQTRHQKGEGKDDTRTPGARAQH